MSPIPARPAKVRGSPPRATPRRVTSASPPGDERGPGVGRRPRARPLSRPPARITFLVAPAISAPTTSVLVYTRKSPAQKMSWSRAASGMSAGAMASTAAAALSGQDLLGQVRPGQDPDRTTGQLVHHHLGHSPLGAGLETLGERHDRSALAHVRPQQAQGVPEAVGRHAHHHRVGAAGRGGDVGSGPQVRMQPATGKVASVLAGGVHDVGHGRIACKQHRRGIVSAQMGDRRAPRPATDHRKPGPSQPQP